MSETGDGRQRCPAIAKSGEPCRGYALKATGFCVGHSRAAAEWRRRGGAASAGRERVAKLLPARLRPLIDALERAFYRVEAGELDARTGVALASMASAIARVYQTGELEQRLRDLEAVAERERQGRTA